MVPAGVNSRTTTWLPTCAAAISADGRPPRLPARPDECAAVVKLLLTAILGPSTLILTSCYPQLVQAGGSGLGAAGSRPMTSISEAAAVVSIACFLFLQNKRVISQLLTKYNCYLQVFPLNSVKCKSHHVKRHTAILFFSLDDL